MLHIQKTTPLVLKNLFKLKKYDPSAGDIKLFNILANKITIHFAINTITLGIKDRKVSIGAVNKFQNLNLSKATKQVLHVFTSPVFFAGSFFTSPIKRAEPSSLTLAGTALTIPVFIGAIILNIVKIKSKKIKSDFLAIFCSILIFY